MKHEKPKLDETPCSCEVCVYMCESIPCWGTKEEIQKIKDAGFGDSLMTDWWESSPNNVYMQQPAMVGFEGKYAPSFKFGSPCTFLTECGKCKLHDLGLKPIEGRMSNHKSKQKDIIKLREYIVSTWENNDE